MLQLSRRFVVSKALSLSWISTNRDQVPEMLLEGSCEPHDNICTRLLPMGVNIFLHYTPVIQFTCCCAWVYVSPRTSAELRVKLILMWVVTPKQHFVKCDSFPVVQIKYQAENIHCCLLLHTVLHLSQTFWFKIALVPTPIRWYFMSISDVSAWSSYFVSLLPIMS